MAKQLNVDLSIKANTSQAQSELKKLQQDLYKIMNISGNTKVSSTMKEASDAAKELSYHLNQAYNTTTGNIDLSKLNTSLQKSSTNVTQLSNKLLQAGSVGQSAFINLSKAISNAEYPMFKLNSKLSEMWITLKNTARWQLSSSMLHGFMGAVQSATSYAQDLDKSLNDIQIVTGISSEKMGQFAEKANRAAKALSTTTTAYTDAALIFYQQGLSDADVEERTNVTIKMAQAAGESATEVSSYMTAIWNNFAQGSDNLEYYGDVLAKLGAETAASSAEIAAGLEKFASIGETIGLSYEYATAAVTTIVDKTRQSADVVGTSLKTIFARLQGLQLGETLEDGVDLNKYSEALEKVGISVLDLNGELRQADEIIYDLGIKWDTLSAAQQTALAQTVAGTRQYAQMMSLMNNFDSFLENVDIASAAEGTLQKQADIFADSWEGAKNRVKAAAEGIYDSLINRDLMKDYNNVLADILTGVENLIDGMGGLGGVISAVGTFALSLISHKIQPAIQGFVLNIKNLFVSAQEQARQLVSDVQLKNNEQIASGDYDTEQVQMLKNANTLTEARARLAVASKTLTDQEAQLYQQDIQMMEINAQKAEQIASIVTALDNQTEQMIEETDATEANTNANRIYNQLLKEQMELSKSKYSEATASTGTNEDYKAYVEAEQAIEHLQDTKEQLNTATNELVGSLLKEVKAHRGNKDAMLTLGKSADEVKNKFKSLVLSLTIPKGSKVSIDTYRSSLELIYKSMPTTIRQSKEVYSALKEAYDAATPEAFNDALKQMLNSMDKVEMGGVDLKKVLQELNPESYKEFEIILNRLVKEEEKLKTAQAELNNALAGFNPQHIISGVERISALASSMGQIAMMSQSISSIIDAWKNEDLSFGEKLSTSLLSFSMLVPGAISSFNSLKTVISGTSVATALYDAALKKMGLTQDEIAARHTLLEALKKKEATSDAAMAASTTLLTGLLRSEGIALDENTAAEVRNKIAEEMKNGASLQSAIVTALTTVKTQADTVVTDKNTASKIAAKLATDGLNASMKALLGPIGLVIGAVTIAITIFSQLAKAEEEAAAAMKENRLLEAEESQKAANEIKKLSDANKDLYKTYIDLRMASDESASAKEKLKAATDDLCAALGVEWNALDRLQGKYEDVNVAILEKRKKQVQETIDAYDRAIEDNRDIIEDKVDEAIEEYDFGRYTYKNGKDSYYANVEVGTTTSDETEVLNALVDYLNENHSDIYDKEYSLQGMRSGEALRFKDGATQEEVLNAINDAFKYIRDNSGIDKDYLDDSEAYQWLRTLYNNSDVSELLAQIAEDEAAREEAIAQMAEINAGLAQAEVESGMAIEEITNIDQYKAYKEQYVNELRTLLEQSGADMSQYTDDVLGDMADKYLSTYSNIANIIENNNIMESIKQESAISDNDLEDLASKYKDFFILAAQIDFDEVKTKEELDNILSILQAEADAKNIQAKINIVQSAKDNLKEDMSYDDYINFEQSSGIKWNTYDEDLKQSIIDYNSFLQMSYNEQANYLDQIQKAYQESQVQNLNNSINSSRELLNQYISEYNGLKERLNNESNGETVKTVRMAELENLIITMQDGLSTVETQFNLIISDILTGVSSLGEFKNVFMSLLDSGINIDYSVYGEALIDLGSKFSNCEDEIKEFQAVLNDTNDDLKEQKRVALEAAIAVGEAAEQYGFAEEEIDDLADAFQDLAKTGKNQYKILGEDGEAAADAAIRYKRLNTAVLDLAENYDDYKDVLKDLAGATDDLDKSMIANSETGKALQSSLAGLLGTSEDLISADFLAAINPDDFEAAAEGDEAAIQRIRDAFVELQAKANNIDVSGLKEELAGLEEGIVVDINADTMPFLYALIEAQIAAGATAADIQSLLSGFNIDATVTDFQGTLAEAVAASESASSEIIANTSFSQDVKTTTVDTPVVSEEVAYSTSYKPQEVESYNLVMKNGADEPELVRETRTQWVKTVSPEVVPTETTDQEVGTEVTTSNAAGDSASVKGVKIENAHKSSGGKVGGSTKEAASDAKKGGGGGGSKPKPAKPSKKKDVVQRYKEIEDKLDDIREEADRTRDSLDRLYGAEHEAAIQRLLELEQQEIDLLKEKEREAQNYLQEDLKELKKVSAEVDVEFKFDDKDNIENYEEEMTELYEELAEIQRKAGDEWDENEQKEIDALNEKIKKLEEAMAAYEETRELLEDINAELNAFKGKPALPLITSDTLDIYWEINDALDDIDEKIKDLERQAEGLSGEEKLKVLEEINRLEQERVAILQQQAEVNQKDIEEKRAALDELARLNGLQFEYDEETGNITNYLEQMGILQTQLDELHAKKAADGLSPDEEEAMNAIIAKMEELADLAGDYRDAVEESEDILNEIEDTLSGVVADPFVRSDFVDIFKETNDQLDDIDRKISKLQNEADKLTGEARRKKLNEIVTLERKRVEILEHQALIAKTEMEDRKRAMEEIAARQELMFEYDENQNITNYQEQLDILIDKYEKAYNEALGDDGLIDATEQAILDSISDDIDHLEEFIQAYCDAVDQLEDIEDEREEIANGGYVDMSQLDDIADELHDINQSLDDLQELLDDSSRAADRLYGEARIKQMEKNASLLQQEIDLLQQKKTAQDDIIAKEKQQLDEKTGGYIKYDEYGRITNYDSYINAREDQIREYEAALQEGGLSETEATLLQDEIDLLNEQIAAMEDYEQALEEKEDIQNQIEDAYYEWQDLNAEKLQYKLELQLDVNDRELAKIERAIKRLDGNFYSRAEALALMVGGGMNGDSKLGNYNKQLADLEAHYQEVKRQYEAGEISQAKYVEMTKELQAEIESTADAMAALQDQMDSYYKDTLAQARQELNFHISQLTHLTGILNHFKNTLTALGKSKDYEMMGTVLEGQVQALENEVKASKNAMQMWQKEADSIYQKYQQALSSGNQENADMYYNAYKEALSAANEAENKFYQQSAAWANALKALMENTLAGLAQDLENALTGGTSFDTITTQMKRASSLQEEYLTTTNKIYETTKLMRTAQQEIDKTTNSVAKQKLSQFITETKQMQNQNKLSKYELSIQQAKYDLLVAEIALEEARFAKSTVRLRRDSEGNFGYIYTADAEAIATAEQKFEDAQNKLYNIGLDGANKYTEKYQQTLAEMYNTLTSLQTKYLQGGFESEAEYNAAVLEAKEYYYEKLNQYSELYSVAINAESGTLTDTLVNNSGIVTDALTKNSRIAADAWSTDFADMTTKTDQWMVAVTDYLSQVQNAFADWEVESQRIANETVGTDLTTLKNKVSDIVTESDNLTAAIGDENNGVIKAIQDEITAVSGLVTEYANLNGQLTQAIQNAQDLSDALQQDIDQAGQDENPPGQYAPGEEESQKPGTVVPEDTEKLPDPPLPEDPSHEHYYVKSKTSPTCTEKGYTTYTCSCGYTYDGDFIDALDHDYTSKVIEEATYEHGNLIRYTCQRCGDTYEEYDNNKKDKPKDDDNNNKGSGEIDNRVDPINPEPPPKTDPVVDNSDKVEGVAASIWMDGSDVSGWGTGNTRKNRLKEKGVSKAQDYINKHAENGDIYAAWHNKRSQLKQYYYGKFDTGGYTGAWGPEGKWAMLHEKEIVLNKEDTKNFLASLELLDNILSTIDLHAMNSQWASNLISPDVSTIGKEALEQMVNIEASFPNATDKHEIEEAFKDLVNLASQYANRK